VRAFERHRVVTWAERQTVDLEPVPFVAPELVPRPRAVEDNRHLLREQEMQRRPPTYRGTDGATLAACPYSQRQHWTQEQQEAFGRYRRAQAKARVTARTRAKPPRPPVKPPVLCREVPSVPFDVPRLPFSRLLGRLFDTAICPRCGASARQFSDRISCSACRCDYY